MSNNNIDLSFLKPKLNKQPEYKQVFIITLVQCQNCQLALQFSKAVMMLTEKDCINFSETQHTIQVKEKALLCANPKLLIGFTKALADISILRVV